MPEPMWDRSDARPDGNLRMVTDPHPVSDYGLAGKVAVVTGGNSGIGRAIARSLAIAGVQVVVAGRRKPDGDETVELIRQDGGDAVFVQTDVCREDEVIAMVDTAVTTYGGLDLAVNNAGWQGEGHPLHEQPQNQWDAVLDTNLRGTFWCMRHEIPRMLERGGGAIVNIASGAGVVGIPGISPYCASKHAVLGLTKSAALDYATGGIRINAINSAAVVTEMYFRLYGDGKADTEAYRALHPIGRLPPPMRLPTPRCGCFPVDRVSSPATVSTWTVDTPFRSTRKAILK